MRCSRARYFARYVSVSDCASVTNDDVNIAAVVSPDDDAADQAERSQATQSSKAASAARPDEAARAASSLRGGDSTAEGAGVSGSLEEKIYNSKVKEEKLEAALTAAKARMAELEIMAAKLRDAGECLNLADMLDPPENLRPESLPPCETQVPWHTTSGSHLPTLAWVDDSLVPDLPQAHRPRLDERLQPKQQTIAEGAMVLQSTTKLSNPYINVSRPPPNIEDPSTWLTFTLPGSSQRR